MVALLRIAFFVLLLMGSTHAELFCPVCKTASESFILSGFTLQREHARCPECKSLERHRHLCLFLNRKFPNLFSQPVRILGVTPEAGIQKLFLNKEPLQYVFEHLPCWSWQDHPHMKNAQILKFDYPDNTFDGIICCHIFSHIDDDYGSLREMLRMLKPGGWVIVMSPYYYQLEKTYEDFSIVMPEDRLQHFGQPDHVRKYGRDFNERLEGAGFEVERASLKDLPSDERVRHGVDGYDDDYARDVARGADIFFCIKKSL
jgi:SAM-dependent methyltransferase